MIYLSSVKDMIGSLAVAGKNIHNDDELVEVWGAPVRVVKNCMGHSSLATTGVYCHPAEGANSAAYLEG